MLVLLRQESALIVSEINGSKNPLSRLCTFPFQLISMPQKPESEDKLALELLEKLLNEGTSDNRRHCKPGVVHNSSGQLSFFATN